MYHWFLPHKYKGGEGYDLSDLANERGILGCLRTDQYKEDIPAHWGRVLKHFIITQKFTEINSP